MVRIIISSFFVVFLVTVNAQVATQTTPSSYLPSLRNTDPSFTPVVVALCCSFLFVLFFAFYLRQCSDANLAVPSLPVAAAAANYTTPCEPQGIDSKLLDTFPILMYSDLKELKLGGGTTSVPLDCAVCLGEFKHDDILRLLPKCNHVFHPDCIKRWLASHVTCPVCRAVLQPAERRQGEEEEEVAVVIRNNQANEPGEVGDRSARRTTAREVSCGRDRGLRRCHSTGHSLDMRSLTKYEVFEGREDEGSSSQGRLFISE